MSKNKIAITMGIICFSLVFAIVIQIKTINNINLIGIQSSSNSELRDDLLKWNEKYESASYDTQKAEEKLEEIRKQAVQNNPELIQKQSNLKNNNTILGLTDVKGEGVIITLKDNNNVTNDNIGIADDIRSYLVHDANLRDIIRKLKISGAEAISVNDERIVNQTSIVCSGNVIRINDRKVGSPFEIKAIGSPELLYGNLKETIESLNNTGIIVEIKKSPNIEIKKFDGVINFNYSKSLE